MSGPCVLRRGGWLGFALPLWLLVHPGLQPFSPWATRRNPGLEAEISKVKDLPAILARGAMSTPALALEGRNLAQGTLPSVAALETLLKG